MMLLQRWQHWLCHCSYLAQKKLLSLGSAFPTTTEVKETAPRNIREMFRYVLGGYNINRVVTKVQAGQQ